jgi:hypothetical protein
VKTKTKFFDSIRDLIASVRTTVARGVDVIQVHTNFEIGRRIVEEEQRGKGRADYGKEIVKALADRLTAEFGKGFSDTNLKLMRLFYLQNQHRIRQTPSGQLAILQPATGKSRSSPIGQSLTDELAILQTLTGKPAPPPPRPFTLSWTHYVFLLGVKNPAERSFYEIETGQQNWTVRELRRQFNSGLYERLALSRDKAGIRRLAREGQTVGQVRDLLKEPLVLEFLGLDERSRYSESGLESAIIGQTERFPAGNGQRLPLRRAPEAIYLRRRAFLRGSGFLQPPAALLCPPRSENRQDRSSGSRTDADVRELFRPLRENRRREFHHRHRTLQAEEQRRWWKSPCPRTPTSMRASINSTSPARTSCSKSYWNGSGSRMPAMNKSAAAKKPRVPTARIPVPSRRESRIVTLRAVSIEFPHPGEPGIDVDKRLHVVVAAGDLREAFHGRAQIGRVDDGRLPRRQLLEIAAEKWNAHAPDLEPRLALDVARDHDEGAPADEAGAGLSRSGIGDLKARIGRKRGGDADGGERKA